MPRSTALLVVMLSPFERRAPALPHVSSVSALGVSCRRLLAAAAALEPQNRAKCQPQSPPVSSRPVLAMQKVEGSSPFIRSREPAGNGGFLMLITVYEGQRERHVSQVPRRFHATTEMRSPPDAESPPPVAVEVGDGLPANPEPGAKGSRPRGWLS